jgi:GrpB-like predicted nucleotidyltransferase (UPF0157 family)
MLAASRAALIGEPEKVDVVVADYDARWPERFEIERAKIAAALGQRALAIEHIGATSVPGLAAKPIIDICLVVSGSSDEASYVPDLSAAGYELRVREPQWHEHRMLRTPERDVHVHMFNDGSTEISRHLLFRDGSAATRLTMTCTRRPSADWRKRTGRRCSTMPRRSPRWSKQLPGRLWTQAQRRVSDVHICLSVFRRGVAGLRNV